MTLSVRPDVREGARQGVRLGLLVGVLAAVRWFFSLGSPQDTTPFWIVPAVAIAAPLLYGSAGAGVALLNRLADRGPLSQVLTGVIVGAVISLCGLSLLPFAVVSLTPREVVIYGASPIGLGLLGGIGFAIYRWIQCRWNRS